MINPIAARRTTFGTLFHHLSIVGLLLAVLTNWCFAQTTSATDGSTPSGLAPGAPAGSYALSDFDNVNLFNGNLNTRLPLLGVGGRGSAKMTMTLSLDTKRWHVQNLSNDSYVSYVPDQDWWEGIKPGYGPGVMHGRWGGVGSLSCTVPDPSHPGQNIIEKIYRYSFATVTFTAGDGTEYELRDSPTGGQPLLYTACPSQPGLYMINGANRGKLFTSTDGNSVTFISDTDIYDNVSKNTDGSPFLVSGYLLLRDGSRYRIDNGVVTWIRDRNGNKLSFTYDASSRVSTITDSLNRVVSVAYDVQDIAPYGLCDRITWNGFGNTPRTLRISKTSLGNALRSGFALSNSHDLFPGLNGGFATYNPTVSSAVWLPDGRSYQFSYNSYAELARVVLPTGGAIEYDMLPGGGVIGEEPSYEIYRRVWKRRILPDGANVASETIWTATQSNYSDPYPWSTTVTVDQRDAGGALLAQEKHYFNSSAPAALIPLPASRSYIYPAWDEGKENQTEALNTASAVQRRSNNTWQQRAAVSWWSGWVSLWGLNAAREPANDPRLTATTTTLMDVTPNPVSKQTFAYSNDLHNNQTDAYEYDFGAGAPGALVRRTHTDYLTVNPVNGADYAGDTNVHLRSLPSQQSVYDSGGNERARMTYEYDNYTNDANHASLVDRPGIAGMDSGFTIAYTKRGNVTRVSRFILANTGLVGSDTDFAGYSQYDIAGNIVKTKDAKGNIAQVDYSSTYQFAYPTTQTSPIPDSSGYYASSTAFTTTIAYDFWTGKVTSTTDPNSQVTTAEYNDVLDRLTRVVRPTGGGETLYQYGDTAGSLYVRTQTKQDTSTWLDDYALFDGLGRAWRSAHYEGPSSWSAKESKFDALGRVSQVSNPYSITTYNAATPAGALWTTTTYDALSRLLSVTTPDGSHVDTAYSGNQTTVTDQSVKKRRSYIDAIGRLTQVTEDPNGLAYQTYYTYDILGNLVKVNQGAQNRYFLYDSLSRLVRTNNPEQNANGNLATSAAGTYPGLGNSQWTAGYVYDSNGNLTSRTDARNVAANYSYDAINRNIYLSYTDGTPAVERHYDFAANGRGRLYYGYSYNAHPVTGADARSYTVINSYDAVGRPLNQTQNVQNSSGVWIGYTVSRSYDLAGHVTSQTYPSGRTVNYSYNAGGRTGSFAGSLGDGVTRTYADTFSYNAVGQMTRERFGTTTNLYHNIHYNSRLQMVDIRLGANAADEWNWNRGALIAYFSNQARSAGNAFLEATDNNGNVTMQEHYVPTDDAISTYAITLRDTYDYDGLNRITQTTGPQRTTAGAWNTIYKQGYDYDQWGNRTISQDSARTWGNGINNSAYTVSPSTNRVNGMGFDFAGNVTNDGGNAREYDAENRMKKAWGSSNWNYYVYDADGKRVRRILGAAETWQVYGIDGELVAEYPVNGAANMPQKEYGYRDGQMLVIGGCDVVRWIVADHLGTPRIEVDATGSLSSVRRHDYLPFGEELTEGMGNGSIRSTTQGYTADCVRQRFGSKERDTETGLDYFGARYFASIQGRFTSPDEPLYDQYEDEPQSWNLYSYVRNSPLINVDRNGKETCYYQNGRQIGCDNAKDFSIKDGILTVNGKGYDLAKLDAQTVVRLSGVEPGHEQRIPYASPYPQFNYGDRTGAKGVAVLAGVTAARPPYNPQQLVIGTGLLFGAGLVYLANHNNLPPPIVIDPNIEARKADLELVDYISDKYKIPRDLLSDRIHWEKQKSGRGGKDNLGKKKIEELAKEIADELKGDNPQN